MRAQVQRGFGGHEVVAVEVLADPVPAAREVVVAVRACGLNRLDLLQRDAPLVRGFSLPHVAGMDVAGVVVARGEGLGPDDRPAIGDAVLVDPVSTCGVCDRCTSGHSPYCEQLRTIGSTRPGGFAELVATPADRCHAIPPGMSFVEAACLPVAYMTAWHALVTVGRVQAGETVLVNAAGAGVSTAVVQFAVSLGATVIGTAGGGAKLEKARALGCTHVVDHHAGDVAQAVLAFTDGAGVDLVIDHVGPALFDASIRSLAIEGRMVFCGTTTGTRVEVDLPSVYHWGRSLVGAGGYRAPEFGEMLSAVDARGLRPVIDSVWPFERLADAQASMEAGSFFGKIVVTFGDAP
jgi:NADPH:quinone reductase-like Zn-dependent oxidoreductase